MNCVPKDGAAMSVQAIALQTGYSVRTVMRLLASAREKLLRSAEGRRLLESIGEEFAQAKEAA